MKKTSKNYNDKQMLEYLGEYYSQFYHSMSANEEKLLVEKMHNGNEEAYKHLFISNMSTVLNSVRRYNGINSCLSEDDLIQTGCTSLAIAIKKFDPKYKHRISTYAYPLIESEIYNSVYKDNQIVSFNTTLINERKIVKKLYDDLNDDSISLDEFFNYVNAEFCKQGRKLLSEKNFKEIINFNNTKIFGIGTKNNQIDIEELFIDENSEERIIDNIICKKYVDQLLTIYINESSKTRTLIRNVQIINLYYRLDGNNPVTDADLAEQFNIYSQFVSHVRNDFIKKIMRALEYGLTTYNDLDLAIDYYFNKNRIPKSIVNDCVINQDYIDNIEYINNMNSVKIRK